MSKRTFRCGLCGVEGHRRNSRRFHPITIEDERSPSPRPTKVAKFLDEQCDACGEYHVEGEQCDVLAQIAEMEALEQFCEFCEQNHLPGQIDACPVLSRTVPECSICFELLTENLTTTNCQHTFHDICINQWHMISETCPICRQ